MERSRGLAVALGGLVASVHVAAADVSIGSAGNWEAAAPLPDERTEVSVTSDGRRLYVLGGFAPAEEGAIIAPRSVYAYDGDQDGWSRLTNLPEGVNHAGVVHLDRKLYVVGGFRGASFDPSDDLLIYDLEKGSWQSGPPLPTARGALAAVVHDGKIHAIGGVGTNGDNTGAHEIFDPASQSWQSAAALPEPRNHIGGALVGDDIMILAGRDETSFELTYNHIYDTTAREWRQGAPVPTGRSGVAAVGTEGYAYIFGGEGSDQALTFDDAERYDPVRDRWEVLPPMPTARHGAGAAVLDGRIHVISGGPEPGFAFSGAHEVLDPPR